ncbi:Gfo/Idh/MocA family protein [Gorillibacterium sp. sgz5001074]|uniref:Gfo/Idh/MocA family protein n=1 Tax=Gorillibacterium sp. sgz5001074 TaxID=3446695 RepID=UPI003F68064A
MALKIGMIGTGWFADMHAKLLAGMEDVRIVSVCGSSLEKAERMAGRFAGTAAYASVHDMLDAEPLDAVYICVPPFAHGTIELALAERNIPFLVEKPLGVDLETPSTILQAVTERKLITSVGYHFRYMDGTTIAAELLKSRTPGMALGYWMGGMPGVYWWRKQDGSGGQFVEQTTHIVDLLRYLLGEVNEVYAVYGNRHMHTTEEDVTVPDVGTVTLRMKNGMVATVANTCMMPIGHTAGLHVYTDAGVLELGAGGLKEILADRTTEYKNRSNPYEAENRAFLHAVRTGDTSGIRSTYENAWKTQQVTVAANRSAESGLPVRLDTLT